MRLRRIERHFMHTLYELNGC